MRVHIRLRNLTLLALLFPCISCQDAKETDDSALPRKAGGAAIQPEVNDTEPAPTPRLLPQNDIQTGWISLFDGGTLFGWKPTTPTGWSVKDGAIVATADTKGFLMTTFELDDYEFRCEF